MEKGYFEPLTNEDDSKLVTIKENKFLQKYTFDIQPIELNIHTISPVKLETK